MTSLKVKYADETMDAMMKILDSTEFKEIYRTASLQKEAGPAFEAFKRDIDAAVTAGTDLELVYTKHVNALAQEDNREPGTVDKARQYMAEKARGKQPGMTVPMADDTCAECLDAKTLAALDFALKHLVKIADALDGKGFTDLAGVVDETIEKMASKKKVTKTAAPESGEELWYALPDMMKEQVIPNWQTLPAAHLKYQLTNPQTIAKIRDRYEQFNRGGLGEEKPVTPPGPGKPSEMMELIKEVQSLVGTKRDGIWGPKTAAAWNQYVKTLAQPWPMMGVDPSGKQAPSMETMKSVLMGAGQTRDMGPAAKPATPAAKPPQISDTEEPGETARQKELRQQFEGMTGGKSITGR